MTQPVAVVGMKVKVAGAATSIDWWRNMLSAVDPIVELNRAGLLAAGVPEPLCDDPDLIAATGLVDVPESGQRWGLSDTAWHDSDPQLRLLLELGQELLDDPSFGELPEDATVATFTAAGPDRQALERALACPDQSWDALLPSGSGPDHIAAHLAHLLDFTGTAMGVSAACAGGALAVALAMDHLSLGRCDYALVSAAHLTTPRYRYRSGGQMSRDGRSRALSASAAGSVPTSAGAVVMLQRLADAKVESRKVLAVLDGAGVSNDGSDRAGYAVPSMEGQIDAVVSALNRAGVRPEQIGAVFCHANGTPLGDALEVAALVSAWRELGATSDSPCRLMAPKTHVGNTDVASGLVALCAAVLALEHQQLPGNLHFEAHPPFIDLTDSPFVIADQTVGLSGRKHLAINAFGVGGTNVHLLTRSPLPGEVA